MEVTGRELAFTVDRLAGRGVVQAFAMRPWRQRRLHRRMMKSMSAKTATARKSTGGRPPRQSNVATSAAGCTLFTYILFFYS